MSEVVAVRRWTHPDGAPLLILLLDGRVSLWSACAGDAAGIAAAIEALRGIYRADCRGTARQAYISVYRYAESELLSC